MVASDEAKARRIWAKFTRPFGFPAGGHPLCQVASSDGTTSASPPSAWIVSPSEKQNRTNIIARGSRLGTLTTLTDEAKIALDTLADRTSALVSPSLRLGVTGLSRAGKTVFITAFVHNLIHGGRLPMFEAQKSGRIARAYLEEQPDDAVPRFQYEDHLKALIDERVWPDSTRAISELRLTIEYESASMWNRMFSGGKLSVDIVDYPGEWLLDLPLLGKSYAEFSKDSFELAQLASHRDRCGGLADKWRKVPMRMHLPTR